MNWIKAIAKTLGPRLIGIGMGSLSGWLYAQTKGTVQIDAEGATQLFTAAMLGYVGAHRAVSSFVNPGDAAKQRVSDAVSEAVAHGTTIKVAPPR